MGSRDGGVARRADVYVCSRVSCRYIGRGVGLRVDRSCRGRYRVEGNIDGITINRVTGVFNGRAIGGMSRGTNGRALNRVRRVFDRRALSRMTGIFSRGRRALNRGGRPGRRRGDEKRATGVLRVREAAIRVRRITSTGSRGRIDDSRTLRGRC
jgi:hypothetical protein